MDKIPEGRQALPRLLGFARSLSLDPRRRSRREAWFVDELPSMTVLWAAMPIEDRAPRCRRSRPGAGNLEVYPG